MKRVRLFQVHIARLMIAALFLATMTTTSCKENAVDSPVNPLNVPDPKFRAFLKNRGITFDANNNITNAGAVASLTNLLVFSENIDDLTGIAAFTGLRELRCDFNNLTSLDVSANDKLVSLSCGGNRLKSLKLPATTNLLYLGCQSNQLTSLNVAANTALSDLNCSDNQLSSLNFSANTALKYLYCDNNKLTSLNVSANAALITLHCGVNQFTYLDLSKNTMLNEIKIENNNSLTSVIVWTLPFPPSSVYLIATGTPAVYSLPTTQRSFHQHQ